MGWLWGVLLCVGGSVGCLSAQEPDLAVVKEVLSVRDEVASSIMALHGYTWTEHIEVLVKKELKSARDLACRYDVSGDLVKKPIDPVPDKANPSAKRLAVRMKANFEDYIERSINVTHGYVPLNPERIQYLLEHGQIALSPPGSGKAELTVRDYYQKGDSVVFTYDRETKALLRLTIQSTLGTPKDPVNLVAIFERLPDGPNHLASTELNAPAKKVTVTTRNVDYKKLPN